MDCYYCGEIVDNTIQCIECGRKSICLRCIAKCDQCDKDVCNECSDLCENGLHNLCDYCIRTECHHCKVFYCKYCHKSMYFKNCLHIRDAEEAELDIF